jgi:hypothetical protein
VGRITLTATAKKRINGSAAHPQAQLVVALPPPGNAVVDSKTRTDVSDHRLTTAMALHVLPGSTDRLPIVIGVG